MNSKPLLPPLFTDFRVLSAVLGLLILAGCGHSGLDVVQVGGQITYGGGAWPNTGSFFFTPVQSGSGRPGSAKFDLEGRFQATSLQEGDGLAPGKYRVTAQCWEGEYVVGRPEPPSFVPNKYRNGKTSDLEITVESGQRSVEVKLDIPKK